MKKVFIMDNEEYYVTADGCDLWMHNEVVCATRERAERFVKEYMPPKSDTAVKEEDRAIDHAWSDIKTYGDEFRRIRNNVTGQEIRLTIVEMDVLE